MKKNEEMYCGNCCWFYAEDTYGLGICPFRFGDVVHCEDKCKNNEYVSRKEMRHHMAVLLQANRYRRDNNVPAIYRMPDPKELGRAIDFSYRYMKVFRDL